MTSRFATLLLVSATTACLDTADLGGGSTSGEPETSSTSGGTTGGGSESTTDVPPGQTSSSSGLGGEESSSSTSDGGDPPPEGGLGPWGFGYVELSDVVARTVSIADFDADGNLDIVAQRRQRGAWQVETWAGAGDGTFESIGQTTMTGWDVLLRAADFDGDGQLDLAAFDGYADSHFAVALGDGAGGFGGSTSIPIDGFFGFGVQPMRFDDDPAADLFIPQGHSEPSVIARATDTGFESAASADPIGCYVSASAVADFDGDGFDEVVASGSCNSVPSYLPLVVFGQIPDGFGVQQVLTADFGAVIEGADIVITDADGDGNTDIVTPTAFGLYVYPGDDGGQFEFPTVWEHAYGTTDAFDGATRRVVPVVRDEDEATMFVLAAAESTGAAGLVEPDGSGQLETSELDLRGRIIGSGDFDGDGRLDVVVLIGEEAEGVLQGPIGIWLSGG